MQPIAGRLKTAMRQLWGQVLSCKLFSVGEVTKGGRRKSDISKPDPICADPLTDLSSGGQQHVKKLAV
jgi:hypothetical protein